MRRGRQITEKITFQITADPKPPFIDSLWGERLGGTGFDRFDQFDRFDRFDRFDQSPRVINKMTSAGTDLTSLGAGLTSLRDWSNRRV